MIWLTIPPQLQHQAEHGIVALATYEETFQKNIDASQSIFGA
jgi:hypothetical protein